MVGRVIELSRSGQAVSKRHGFLTVTAPDQTEAAVSLDDIEAVLVSNQAVTWSNAALSELAAQQVPVMVLGANFAPVAIVLPLDGHHQQAARFQAQAAATMPLKKQAWAAIVRHKIAAQIAGVSAAGTQSERLNRLVVSVRSGDPENREAQAAQIYWPLLLGKNFRRDRNAEGANAMLNYGYAVLRAATARAIVASGLHPSLPLHHQSGGDALALADDLMEPFRPTIDLCVWRLINSGVKDVPGARETLVGCLNADFLTANGASPLSQVLVHLAQSLARSFECGKMRLEFPRTPLPAEAPDD